VNNLIPVKDNPDLFRDPYSKSIVSGNISSLEQARKRKFSIEQKFNKLNEIEDIKKEINNLNNRMEYIKEGLDHIFNVLTKSQIYSETVETGKN
jgi:hypothetical protein